MGKEENIKKDKSVEEQDIKETVEESEVLENLPPEIKKVVEMGVSMQRISGPMSNPIMSKLNENHIDRILDIS